MRQVSFTILLVFLFAFIPSARILAFNLDSVMNIVEAKYATVNDYTCKFSKKEYLDGDYIYFQNVVYKYRKPDNYYMNWTEGSQEGTEVIYAGKKYNYKIIVHLGGILNLTNFYLDPKGSIAMKKSRHPIMDSDMGFMIRLMRKNLQEAKNLNTGKVEYFKEVTLNKRKANAFKAEFPENKGFYGHSIYIYLDNLLNLPVKLDVYDWNDRLIESYTMSDLEINVGLKDIDFDTKNDSYNF